MNKRLNKKGFTLIELMVTIVIMLSILILSIISVDKISDRQKQKAFDQTKKQIITAAKEYFSDNEYFIRSVAETKDEVAYISLGTLVKLDYINVVTNPFTGQKLNECTVVVVKKGSYEYDETKYLGTNCVMSAAEIGIPKLVDEIPTTTPKVTTSKKEEEELEPTTELVKKFNVYLYSKNKSNCGTSVEDNTPFSFNKSSKEHISKWYNYANGIYLVIEDKDSNDPDNNNTYKFKDDNSCVESDGETKKIIVDSSGEEYTLNVRLDRVPPTIVYSVSNTNWTNADSVSVTINLEDNLSHLESEIRYWNETGLNESSANSATYKWSDSKNIYPSGGKEETTSTIIYNQEKYSHTELYKKEGFRKGKVKACDIAGNCALSNEYYAKLDRTSPVVKVETDTSSWVNTDVNYTATATDNIELTSLYAYWNKYGKTESEATSSDCKWQSSSYGKDDCKGGASSSNLLSSISNNKFTSSFSAQGSRRVKFKACDIAGNCTYSNEAIARIDTTKPTVTIKGYIGTEKRLGTITSSNVDSVIKDHLVERTSESTWVGGHLDSIILKAVKNDSMSGVKSTVCTDPRPNTETFSGWRRVTNSSEGVFTFNCTITDNAGNTNTDSYVVKRDITPPVIKSFANTKNTSCVSSNGYKCYYSHKITAQDSTANSSSVSGLASNFKYNHCYDNATSSQTNILCPTGYKSTESKKTTSIYPDELNGKTYGYANRYFSNGVHTQDYTHENLSGYYNLFYKIYDNVGNSVCYRYKLKYTDSNKYTTAVPTYVSKSDHCDDK